jgi:putative transposase
MPRRKVYDHELYAHFITFSCYRRRRLLDHDHAKRIVLGVLNDQLRRLEATCIGFVLMPDHVHTIVWLAEPGQLSRFMHGWKRRSSYEAGKWYRQGNARYLERTLRSDPFWQRKYYAFEIYSRQKLVEKLDYMHLNPVRAGLVDKAAQWKWSSARWYSERRPVGVPIGWVG